MAAKTTVRRLRKGMVLILFAAVVMTVCVSYHPVYIAERRRTDNARLFAAVRGGDTAAVRSLLNGFADANAHDLLADNRTLWRRCLDFIHGEHTGIASGVLTPLQVAVMDNGPDHEIGQATAPTEIVHALLAHGANVNEKDANGLSVISLAAGSASHFENNNSDCLLLLLAHGADINAETINGYSLLYCAILWDDTRLSNLLKKRGAKCCIYGEVVPIAKVEAYAHPSSRDVIYQRP